MSIASGFHPNPPSGKFSTTAGNSNVHLETSAEAGVITDGTTLFTEYDAIHIPTAELLLIADMLIRHHQEITSS